MLIVCVSILPGPIRVKVPLPSLLNLSLELAVAGLHVSSLKVKGTSKRRERGGEGDREHTVFTMYIIM